MLSNDPLEREWVELSGSNPGLVSELGPHLVTFLAFSSQRVVGIAGTGVLLGGNPDIGLVLTAKHVLNEGVLRIQKPDIAYSPSAIFLPQSSTRPSAEPSRLKVSWIGNIGARILDAPYLNYIDPLDIAVALVIPSEDTKDDFGRPSIPLDLTYPSVGDLIHIVTRTNFSHEELAPPSGPDGFGQEIRIGGAVSIRRGTVTGVYNKGYRQYRWPCFTTSIPAEPGMSGGFAYIPRDGQAITACGIVCADNSSEEARSNPKISGESVMASIWPALSLSVPSKVGGGSIGPSKTLHQLMIEKAIPEPWGEISKIKFLTDEHGGQFIHREADDILQNL